MTASRKVTPYLLILPGSLWLAIFYLAPIASQIRTSLESGTFLTGMRFTWDFANYVHAALSFAPIFGRSFMFAAIATFTALVIGYPLAYTIVFRTRRYRTLFLFPIVMPFLVSYLIRTISWEALLSDGGVVTVVLRSLALMPSNGHILSTPTAVVLALAYNFMPFTVLPIYVSLSRIDDMLLQASADLYARPPTAFWRVVLPLSLPGVFAGGILTFIPAAGDYVNAMLLGGPKDQMIGNVIRTQYLVVLDYPLAAAASVMLMIALIACVGLYAQFFHTGELTG